MPNLGGIIPNQGGAFGQSSGIDDPQNQQDEGVAIQQGGFNLYPQVQGAQATLQTFRTAFTPGGPLKILYAGDSIFQGVGWGGTTIPFANRLQQMARSFWGLADGGVGLVTPPYAGLTGTGVTAGGTPAAQVAGYGPGNSARLISAANTYTFDTAAMAFTMGSKNVQSADVMYVDIGAFGGDIQYQIDGGAVQNLVTAKVGDFLVKTVNIPAGAAPAGFAGNTTHTIKILGTGLGTIFVGIIIYAATTGASGIQSYNAGVPGSTSFDWTNKGGGGLPDPLSFIDTIQPHLTFIGLGVNDVQDRNIKNVQDYAARIFSIMLKCKGYGDIVLVAPPMSNPLFFPTSTASFTFARLEQELQALSLFGTCPMLNLHACWGDYATYQAAGLAGDVFVHPNNTGHRDIANRLWKVVNLA